MEENLLDIVVDELVERQRMVKEELRRRFKRTKPFRMTPVSNDEMLLEYDMMTPEKMNERVARDGEFAVNQYIMEMEQLKKKRGIQ